MPDNKSTLRFWPVFLVLVTFAVLASLANLLDFMKMNKLQTEGKRRLFPVDSVYTKGTREEIFVNFAINGKIYQASKKVKSNIVIGDTVPVYYMEDEPSNNAIAAE